MWACRRLERTLWVRSSSHRSSRSTRKRMVLPIRVAGIEGSDAAQRYTVAASTSSMSATVVAVRYCVEPDLTRSLGASAAGMRGLLHQGIELRLQLPHLPRQLELGHRDRGAHG